MADDAEEVEYPALLTARNQTMQAPSPGRNAKVRWRRKKFAQFIEQHGMRLLWLQAIPCPCMINSQTQQPNPLCSICGGGGFEYFDPREIRGLVTDVTGDYMLFPGAGQQRGYAIVEKFGEWYAGEAMLSVRPENPVGFRDRLIMLDAAIEFSEILERKTTDPVIRLRYRIVPRVVELYDIEAGVNVCDNERVVRLRVWDVTNDTTRVLREGADFDVIPTTGHLDFSKGDIRGTAPAVGDRYAIKYNTNPPWIVHDLRPQFFRQARSEEHPTKADLLPFPRTLGIALDFLVRPETDE